MTASVLVLNAHPDSKPFRIVSWWKAFELLQKEVAYTLSNYEGRVLRSPSREFPWPAVIAYKTFVPIYHQKVRLKRGPIFARDRHTCQYCSYKPEKNVFDELSIDHVVAKAHAKEGMVTLPWSGLVVPVHSWLNVTTSCKPCNNCKGSDPLGTARGPDRKVLRLKRRPYQPKAWDIVRMNLSRLRHMPDEWRDFVPKEWLR